MDEDEGSRWRDLEDERPDGPADAPDPPDEAPGPGDAELYDRLAAQDFTGCEQEVFNAQLVAYALPIILGWIGTGKIYAKCAEIKRVVRPSQLEADELRDRELRIELTLETLAHTLVHFRDHALRGGKWRPDGGASLRTYFVNAAVRQFPNVFHRWSRSLRRQPPARAYGLHDADLADQPATTDVGQDPADVVVEQIIAEQRLEQMPVLIRAIVQRRLDGTTYKQIARELNMTVRKIESALDRYRRSLREGGST